jgi:hypothetical protein
LRGGHRGNEQEAQDGERQIGESGAHNHDR